MGEKRFHVYEDKKVKFERSDRYGVSADGKIIFKPFLSLDEAEKCCDLLNRLNDENMELKERNQRQAERLDNLYRLIEAEDWRTLSDILDDFKHYDEQLRMEECTYAR